MGQLWAVNSLGGFMYSLNLSKKLRMAVQPEVKFAQLCDVKDATQQGKSKGDTYHWNVYSDVATAGTTLVETNTMPETQYVITQGTLTITEMGNSVPFSGKLNDLSEQPVTEIINKVLKNDAKGAFDTLAHAEFNKTPLKAYAYGGTSTTAISLATASTVGGTSSKALAKGHVRSIVQTMKERNIPAFVQDDYYCISWPTTFAQLDLDLEAVQVYTAQGYQMIMNGEKGRYANCRFIEQTNIAKAGTTYTDWAFFCGEDTVAEAIAVPMEMRGKIPSDYGRSKGVAWYYLGKPQIIDMFGGFACPLNQ